MSQPPRVGPSTGATTTPKAKTAMAAPRLAGGNDSSRMAWEIGCSAPPPAPWMTRARSRKPSVGAAPQAKLATVKMATQDIRKRLRPKRSENQLLAGRMMAFATR